MEEGNFPAKGQPRQNCRRERQNNVEVEVVYSGNRDSFDYSSFA